MLKEGWVFVAFGRVGRLTGIPLLIKFQVQVEAVANNLDDLRVQEVVPIVLDKAHVLERSNLFFNWLNGKSCRLYSLRFILPKFMEDVSEVEKDEIILGNFKKRK